MICIGVEVGSRLGSLYTAVTDTSEPGWMGQGAEQKSKLGCNLLGLIHRSPGAAICQLVSGPADRDAGVGHSPLPWDYLVSYSNQE